MADCGTGTPKGRSKKKLARRKRQKVRQGTPHGGMPPIQEKRFPVPRDSGGGSPLRAGVLPPRGVKFRIWYLIAGLRGGIPYNPIQPQSSMTRGLNNS